MEGHKLIGLKECYDTLARENSWPSVSFASAKKEFDKILEAISGKIWRFQQDFVALEDQIKKNYEVLKEKIKKLRRSNLEYLQSAKNGIQKKIGDLVWMEHFLKFQLMSREPLDFLDSYFLHQSVLTDILGDLKLNKNKLELVKNIFFIIL